MSNIKITYTHDERIVVESPFDEEFVRRVRALAGEWDAKNRAWTVPSRYRDQLYELLARCYGYLEPGTECVLVRLTTGELGHCSELHAAGRLVGKRNDARNVLLGPTASVFNVENDSMEWYMVAKEGTEFEIELPKAQAEQLAANPTGPWKSVEIIEQPARTTNLWQLQHRRRALQKEIEEVGAAIAACEAQRDAGEATEPDEEAKPEEETLDRAAPKGTRTEVGEA